MNGVEQFTLSGTIYGDPTVSLRFDEEDDIGRRMIVVGLCPCPPNSHP